MAIHIPADMSPRMDWNTEDKQAVWAFYRESLKQYFVIVGTPPPPGSKSHTYLVLQWQRGI